MNFIFGGRCQGKLSYAKQQFGNDLTVCDLKYCDIDEAFKAGIIINLQDAVKSMLLDGKNPTQYFIDYIDRFSDKVIIGDEIGCGVVPIDAFEREWRDETGRVYQMISAKADTVDRVWSGLGHRVNG